MSTEFQIDELLRWAYMYPRPVATHKGNLQGESVIVYSDGGCRPNPGVGAIGVCITHMNIPVLKAAYTLGPEHCTNNVAEYLAAMVGIAWAGELVSPGGTVHLQTDSKLVSSQIDQDDTATNPHMIQLRRMVLTQIRLLAELGTKVTVARIPRELNTQADDLVNSAFEGREEAALLLHYSPPRVVKHVVRRY